MSDPTRPRRAFVTGARSGLGRAIAQRLLDEGYEVWGTGREATTLLAAFSNRSGFHAVPEFELSSGAPLEARFLNAQSEAGAAFDVVVLNAGYGVFAPFVESDFCEWQAQFEALISGNTRVSQLALRGMLARGSGTLVLVSSMAAEFPIPYLSGYNMAKAALSALSESLLLELGDGPVRVIDFRPGDCRTPFNDATRRPALPSHASEALRARLVRVWERLEANLVGAPSAERIAEDLCRALHRGRRGILRSGSFFQVRLAPFLARFGSASLRRRCAARYFHLR